MIRKKSPCMAVFYVLVTLAIMSLKRLNEELIRARSNEHIGGSDHLTNRRLTEYDQWLNSQEKLVDINDPRYKGCKLNTSIDYQCPSTCVQGNHHTVDLNKRQQNSCQLKSLVANCEVLKILHLYDTVHVTPEERRFPLAFAMYVSKDAEAAEQIFRTIYRSQNVFCFHVDQNANRIVFEIMQRLAACFENVVLITDRERMVTASYNIVRAELKCMEALLTFGRPWRYYINLSENEYPLRTNLEMVRILSVLKGLNDIETYDRPVFHSWRQEQTYEMTGNSIVRSGNKDAFKYKIKIGMGNQHGLFSRAFVNFLLHDDVAQDIMSWFNDTFAPAEHVWSTLVTLPWAPGGYPVTIRHMIDTYMSRAYIQAGDNQKCHGRYASAICQLSCGDLPWLKARPQFFANDFEFERDRDALNCLERWCRQKSTQTEDVSIDLAYYMNLPHLKYHRSAKRFQRSKQKLDIFKQEWLANNLIT